jgi:hypothetical protein
VLSIGQAPQAAACLAMLAVDAGDELAPLLDAAQVEMQKRLATRSAPAAKQT